MRNQEAKQDQQESWRVSLDEIVRHRGPRGITQLCEVIGINRTTFLRWRKGDQIPEEARLKGLLDALQEDERDRLLDLLLADPQVRSLVPSQYVQARGSSRLPADLYEQVLAIASGLPDPLWLGCDTLLSRLLTHLGKVAVVGSASELPEIELTVALSLPSTPDGRIHSLYESYSLGTKPWNEDLHEKGYFLGASSLPGQVVLKRRAQIMPELASSVFSQVQDQDASGNELSSAASPLMRRSRIAGALLARCRHPHSLTAHHLALLKQGADLLSTLLPDTSFHEWSSFDLGRFPPPAVQQPYLATFEQRLRDAYAHVAEGESSDPTRIEQQVRANLERELLALAYPSAFPK